MPVAMPFYIKIDDDAMRRLGRALRAEADGAQIKKDLVRSLRAAMTPARDEVKQSIRTMPTHSRHAGASLRRTVAQRIGIQTQFTGRRAGVRLKSKKTPGARDFANAPKRLNSRKGFRHPVFGDRDAPWHRQLGKPGWFDDPLKHRAKEFRAAVHDVLTEVARRIALKTR